jgi:hypothetical protein
MARPGKQHAPLQLPKPRAQWPSFTRLSSNLTRNHSSRPRPAFATEPRDPRVGAFVIGQGHTRHGAA